MAEGFARARIGDHVDVYSAGIATHGLNPNAVRAMAEADVDISGHESKLLKTLLDDGVVFDRVYTVCGHADENCPIFPGKTEVIHHGFDDPPKLAKEAATEEEGFDHYRRVRDEIKSWIASLEF
jgi:arsenate reductase